MAIMVIPRITTNVLIIRQLSYFSGSKLPAQDKKTSWVFHDEVGQPDPQSNIRPFLQKEKDDESPSERYLRKMRSDVQQWNHDFWLEQNANFQRCKKEFLSKRYQNRKMKDIKEGNIHPDELAEFYRRFLNDNYEMHISYNKQWYKKNFFLLALTIYTKLNGIYRKIIFRS